MKIRSFSRAFFLTHGEISQGIIKNLGNLILVLLSFNPQHAKAQQIESIDQLHSTITQFLIAEYRNTNASKVDVKVGALDTRLRLEKCDQALTLNLQDPSNNGGNINVKVACRGSSHWSILVPVQAIVFRPMAVASRNLQRGELISDADVSVEVLDVSQYQQNYANGPEDVIGKELKYPVNKGDAFRNSVLDTQLAIKRGDVVSVVAMAGSIRVTTKGTAVSNGRVGQQIRVKNNQSERILSATVIGPGEVQSIL